MRGLQISFAVSMALYNEARLAQMCLGLLVFTGEDVSDNQGLWRLVVIPRGK